MNKKIKYLDNTTTYKKRVLIVAYALSPVLGSEYRSAWELVKEFSQHHHVTVLFGDSDGLMGHFEHFDRHEFNNEHHFRAIKIHATKSQISLAKIMLKMPWSLAFPLLLKSWHRKAFEIAKSLHEECPFDVAHQLGPIGFRNPGYLWKLDCHTYWGPVGGAQLINTKMIKNKNSLYIFEAMIRNLSVRLQVMSPYIAQATNGFDRISFATIENANYFRKNFNREGPLISDQGLINDTKKTYPKSKVDTLIVTWAGSLTARKNVDALIEVIKNSPSNIHYNILGSGPREADLRSLEKQLPNLNYHGPIPRTEVFEKLRISDVILITSLSEANTAILFEALECDCIPVVPRINGFVSVLNNDVAYLIDQTNFEHTVTQIVEALSTLTNSHTRKKYIQKIRKHKGLLTWRMLSQSHLSQYE